MNRGSMAITFAAALLGAATFGSYLLLAGEEQAPVAAAEESEECSSCTLRHKSIGKDSETLEQEAAKLRELFEESKKEAAQD